jgi:hypothetical protein
MRQAIIDKLDDLAISYNIKLFMPPFNGGTNPFFYIGVLKNDAIMFRNFFKELDKVDVGFKFVEIDGKKDYMEITP